MVLNALEPEYVAKNEPSSVGFRPKRSVVPLRGQRDATNKIVVIVSKRVKRYVLDADIAGCPSLLTIIHTYKTFPPPHLKI